MYKKSKREEYFKTKGCQRLRYASRISIVAVILGIIVTILALVYVDKIGWFDWLFTLFSFLETPSVYAGNGNVATTNETIDLKTKINGAIMVCIVIAFFWSLAVCLHSENENKVAAANDINKMLLGFLIGSAKTFLGL